MKIYLSILLVCGITVSQAQRLFDEKFGKCSPGGVCVNCGDSIAHPKKDLGDHLKTRIEHTTSHFESSSGIMYFEIFVDSAGDQCVVSVQDQMHKWELKNNIVRAIDEMHNWQPAVLAHHPISSTVILKIHFVSNEFRYQFVRREDIEH